MIISVNPTDEPDSAAVLFFFEFSEDLSHAVSFTWSTSIESTDTAEADDFDAVTNKSVLIDVGIHGGTLVVFIHDDDVYEGDETFTVTISNLVNATVADDTFTGTIVDDETEPTLSIADASATEGLTMNFDVDLSWPSEADVTFDYATSIGADDNSESFDFTGRSGTVTIPAYSLNETVSVDTSDDGHNTPNSRYEGDETFTMTISNPVGAGISRATAKGTIIEDESIPEVSFPRATRTLLESAGTVSSAVEFAIHPVSESSLEVSLVITGSATRDDDYYTALPQTLTISSGQALWGRSLSIEDDSIFEGDETIIIQLVATSDNIRVDPNADTLTITIDDGGDRPTLSFDSPSIIVAEEAGPAVLTVNMDTMSAVPITVDYETRQRTGALVAQEG